MSPEEVERKVRELTAKILRKPPEQVTLESRYTEDLGADSLGLLELMYELERAFDIPISDEQAAKIRTVGEAVRCLAEAVRR